MAEAQMDKFNPQRFFEGVKDLRVGRKIRGALIFLQKKKQKLQFEQMSSEMKEAIIILEVYLNGRLKRIEH